MVRDMKDCLNDELSVMRLVKQVELCKKLVRYVKKSDLMPKLSKSLKQEVDVRWNSVATMLQSIDDVWDEVISRTR